MQVLEQHTSLQPIVVEPTLVEASLWSDIFLLVSQKAQLE